MAELPRNTDNPSLERLAELRQMAADLVEIYGKQCQPYVDYFDVRYRAKAKEMGTLAG